MDNAEFRDGKENAGITENERAAIKDGIITPIDESELLDFMKKYKNEKEHPQYFKCFKK